MSKNKNMFLGGTYQSAHFTPFSENGFNPSYSHMVNNSLTMIEKIPGIEESNKLSDHDIDCDPNINDDDDDDENEGKSRKRTGKRHQSKNLEAERKRRKKLNDRLYTLRALVPNISKLDRAAILGDAINYIKDLEKQVKNLQFELEQDSDIDENNDVLIFPETKCGPEIGDQNREVGKTNSKVHQMEPQVEVFEMGGNELFVKVLCEYKAGGFVRQIEALTSLGFKVINVNTTRHTCLVSNLFRVEKRESGTIQAVYVRESLTLCSR